jgi:spermidine synthase
LLSDSGIVVYPSSYDTDRYISPEKANVLSVIYHTFSESFDTVVVWPGQMTIFFGFVNARFAVPTDTVIARANRLSYRPTYLSESQLMDRLGEFRVQRLNSSLSSVAKSNTINQPILPYYQVVYRSPAQSIERKMFASLFERSTWLVLLPLVILVLFVILVTGRNRARQFSLFLYFTAGAVSLSLELVSFYVYQSLAGSLYSELAILIGAFMLGLAIGTFYAFKIRNPALAFPALILMAIASLLFLVTYDIVAARMLLVYHLMFQFTVALATGTLFVAATSAYYPIGREVNRGAGYAAELLGSSLGALTITTVLLPAIGLQWVLIAITGLTLLAIMGTIVSSVTRDIV